MNYESSVTKSLVVEEYKDPLYVKYVNSKKIAVFEALAVYEAIKRCPHKNINLAIYCDNTQVQYAFRNLDCGSYEVAEIV